MPPFAHLLSFRHRAVWLLAIGLFAMAMHAFGGSGRMRENSADGGFYAEICTSKGLSNINPAHRSGTTSPADNEHQNCCKLCGTSAPLLTADAALGVPSAPIFSGLFFALPAIRPAAIARVSHPPRGPPLV
jgi:hypothetical protein